MNLLEEEEALSPAMLIARSGLDERTVRMVLTRLTREGLVEKAGWGLYRMASPSAPPELDASEAPGPHDQDSPESLLTFEIVGENGATPGVAEAPATLSLPPTYVARLLGWIPNPGQVCLLRVQGDSMEPWLTHGEDAWIERTRMIHDDGRYALRIDDTLSYVVKRVSIPARGRLVVSSDNRSYAPVEYVHVRGSLYREVATGRPTQLHVLGRVIYPSDKAAAILRELVVLAKRIGGHP